jgi:hypothetical protein
MSFCPAAGLLAAEMINKQYSHGLDFNANLKPAHTQKQRRISYATASSKGRPEITETALPTWPQIA